MAVLVGGAVSYERGIPVWEQSSLALPYVYLALFQVALLPAWNATLYPTGYEPLERRARKTHIYRWPYIHNPRRYQGFFSDRAERGCVFL